MNPILRQTRCFTCRPARHRVGSVTITAKDAKATPRQRTVTARTWAELQTYSDATFYASCCWDLGLAAFLKA